MIFLCVVEYSKNVLAFFFKRDLIYSHQSVVEEEVLFWFFSEGNKPFVAERKLGLHKRELPKYHECFPILVFGENQSIEISL